MVSNLQRKDANNDYNPLLLFVYEELVKIAEILFKYFSDYMDEIRISNPCTFKGEYPLSHSDVGKYDERIKSITSIFTPSEYATEDIGSITSKYSTEKNMNELVGYKLLAPIVGSCVDNGNLISGFLTFPAHTAANM